MNKENMKTALRAEASSGLHRVLMLATLLLVDVLLEDLVAYVDALEHTIRKR